MSGALRTDVELSDIESRMAPEHRPTVQNGRGSRPKPLVYVDMTAAALGWTGALRRRTAAEMRVIRRPTGRGSMNV
jgi:hypothetical protein